MQIATTANAAFGSIYHHFPWGKEQISEEMIRASRRAVEAAP